MKRWKERTLIRTEETLTWKLSHGDPGLKLMPPSGNPYKCANSLVLLHVFVSLPFWHANSHNFRLSICGMIWDVKKHSVIFHNRQIDPAHSPLMQSWVPIVIKRTWETFLTWLRVNLTVITLSFVITWLWFRTLRCRSIAIATPWALGFFFTFDPISDGNEGTSLTLATGTLTGTALCTSATSASLGCCIQTQVVLTNDTWITTTILTLFIIETTITFLATLDDFVAAKRSLRHLEAIAFLTLFYGI